MIDVTYGFGTWILLLASLGADARPPVEAMKPRPAAEAAKPAASAPNGEATDKGTNSGGPGSPADEAGTPAPAAEADASQPKERKGIWAAGRKSPEQPKPLLPTIAGEPSPADPTPAEPIAPTRPTDPLDRQVDEAIDVTARRVLSVDTHTPWQIGHGMLAFRRDYVLRKGNQKINAYEWVATNPTFRSKVTNEDGTVKVRDLNWFYLTPNGARPQKYTGTPYEFEGHPNQFLAFFALARLPLDFEFTVQGRKVTYDDMLRNAKMEVNDREEVTWDLWAFAYYFDPDDQWMNARGEPWSMERLVSTTLRQFSPTKSPCGGCHALFALASARNAYVQTKKRRPVGAWTHADQHLEKHIELARRTQNRDGSFSSNYFKSAGYSSDPSKRISTTGHTLEFLMMALQRNRLHEPWVRNAVSRLSHDLIQYQAEPLEVGGMYHAAHALVLYRERTRPQVLAKAKDVTPAAADASPADKVVTPEKTADATEKFQLPKKAVMSEKAAPPETTREPKPLVEPKKIELPEGAEPKKLELPAGEEAKPLEGSAEKANAPTEVKPKQPVAESPKSDSAG